MRLRWFNLSRDGSKLQRVNCESRRIFWHRCPRENVRHRSKRRGQKSTDFCDPPSRALSRLGLAAPKGRLSPAAEQFWQSWIRIDERIAAARRARDRASKQLHRQMQSHPPGFLIVRGVRKT